MRGMWSEIGDDDNNPIKCVFAEKHYLLLVLLYLEENL